MAQAVPGLGGGRRAPWAERVLLPVCATALIGGWLAFQGLVIWIVLERQFAEILPPIEKRARYSIEPAIPRPGDTISIHYDWSGIDEGYEQARCALTYDPVLPSATGAIPQPQYVWIRRGETPEWKIPADAERISIISLKPSRSSTNLDVQLGR